MIETLKCSAYTLVYPHHFQMLKYEVRIGQSAIDNKERHTSYIAYKTNKESIAIKTYKLFSYRAIAIDI